MRREQAKSSVDKGWLIGPWNSDFNLSIGYANTGIDEPHVHSNITEFYLVARGSAEVRVQQRTITVSIGDLLQIDPGEAHTFLSSSDEYFHFVIHLPGSNVDDFRDEKELVSGKSLGL